MVALGLLVVIFMLLADTHTVTDTNTNTNTNTNTETKRYRLKRRVCGVEQEEAVALGLDGTIACPPYPRSLIIHDVHFTPYTIYNIHYTLYTIHYTIYTIYTLYSLYSIPTLIIHNAAEQGVFQCNLLSDSISVCLA